MNQEIVVELTDVTRIFGTGDKAVHALRGVSVQVCTGELVAVMGPSGSGKSSLLHVAGGLDTVTAGSVRVEGQDLAGMSDRKLAEVRRRHIGFVFQALNLVPSLTVLENVALPMELDGMSIADARQVAVAALEEIELSSLGHRFPDELSGGQQQRVAIARALTGERRLLLADEPTGALDTETGEAVMRVLRSKIDAGAAGILVTHDARLAAWADRVIYLRDGAVIDATGNEVTA